MISFAFFVLVVNAIVMNGRIDDDVRVIVLSVCIVVFSQLFIWIES